MRATKRLAKLYTMPPEHGEITAFDSYASHLYVGTDKGTILHLSIEGLPEYPSPAAAAAATPSPSLSQSPPPPPLPLSVNDDGVTHEGCDGGDDTTAAAPAAAAPVITNLLCRVAVSDQRSRVQELRHSRTQALLFVLCDHHLTVWSTAAVLTFLCEIGSGISCFFVSPRAPPSPPPPPQGRGGGDSLDDGSARSDMAPRQLSTSAFSDTYPSQPPALALAGAASIASGLQQPPLPYDSGLGAAMAAATHLIVAAQHKGRGLLLYEFNALMKTGTAADDSDSHGNNTSGGGGGAAPLLPLRAVLLQELLLPEPALSLAMVSADTVCVGMRLEYSLLSIASGASRCVLRPTAERRQQRDSESGHGGRKAPPLIALGDHGEIHLGLHRAVYSVYIDDMSPGKGVSATTTAAAAVSSVGVGGGSEASLPLQSTAAATAAAAAVSTVSGVVSPSLHSPQRHRFAGFAGRSLRLLADPTLVVCRYPFLFAFTADYCSVFSAFTIDNTSPAAEEGGVEPVEVLPLPGCRFSSQLAKGETIFAASATSVWMARLLPLRTQLADLVASLQVDAAFELLSAARRSSSSTSSGSAGIPTTTTATITKSITASNRGFAETALELHAMSAFAYLHYCCAGPALRHFAAARLDPRELTVLLPECLPPPEHSAELKALLLHNEDGDDGSGYWDGWPGPCPYNTCAAPGEQLVLAWRETFESFPLTAVADGLSPELRLVPFPNFPSSLLSSSSTPVTFERFAQGCWEGLKDAMVEYFTTELHRGRGGSAGAAGAAIVPSHGRAMSLALLVFALERRDTRAAHAIVAMTGGGGGGGGGLALADCYDLLSHLGEYRLLALLLFRHGRAAESRRLIDERLSLRRLLESVSGSWGEGRAPLPYLPSSMEAAVLVKLGPSHRPHDHDHLPQQQQQQSESLADAVPGDLSEVFPLLDRLDLLGLRAALRANPALARCRDSDGCTPLHHLFHVLLWPQAQSGAGSSNTNNTTSSGDGFGSSSSTSTTSPARLQIVMAGATMLVDYGCPTGARSYAGGVSCLDIVAAAATGGGGGGGPALIDTVTACLLSAVEVTAAASAAMQRRALPNV